MRSEQHKAGEAIMIIKIKIKKNNNNNNNFRNKCEKPLAIL